MWKGKQNNHANTLTVHLEAKVCRDWVGTQRTFITVAQRIDALCLIE